MATTEELKNKIDEYIYPNIDGDIGGEILNEILNEIVDAVGEKQDVIDDVDTIREGSELGATSVQSITIGTTTTGDAGTDAEVSNSGTEKELVLNFKIPKGADASNPFKGWYDTVAKLQEKCPSPSVGDYAHVKGSTSSDPASIYECATAGTWTDSGRTADPSNTQTFESGEQVNETSIVNNLTTGGATDVLAAEQGVVLKGMASRNVETGMSASSTVEGTYISSSSGNVTSFRNYTLLVFDVSSYSSVKVTAELVGSLTTPAYQYAFYSSLTSFSSSTKVGAIGPKITNSTYVSSVVLEVPEGAAALVVTNYNASSTKYITQSVSSLSIQTAIDVAANCEQVVSEIEEDNETRFGSLYKTAFHLSGENLYVAYNDGSGVEITYWFKRCMANSLYTFYRVGYRSASTAVPSTSGISAGTGITVINKTGSDNIGPLSMNTGGWVGANHTYGNDGVLTAETNSFAVFADGVELASGDKGFANSVTVKVVNTIYDPAFEPASGDTILSTPLSTETVTYRIRKNTIEVGVTQQFVTTTTNRCNTYYGMQSMMEAETHVMTPNGQYPEWTTISSVGAFAKADYPNFNRFIEKGGTYYQAAYLIPTFSLGKKEHVSSENYVFTRNSSKDYHFCIREGGTEVAGKTFQWAGCYTFFVEPIVDDGNLFAYVGSVRGKDVIFASCSDEYSGSLPIPSDLSMKKISVIENNGFTNEDDGTDFEIGGNGIIMKSETSASLIIQFD